MLNLLVLLVGLQLQVGRCGRMKSCRSISRVLALGLMGATLTAAFLPAPTAILPARSNPTACRVRESPGRVLHSKA